jgi:hypothetical protein
MTPTPLHPGDPSPTWMLFKSEFPATESTHARAVAGDPDAIAAVTALNVLRLGWGGEYVRLSRTQGALLRQLIRECDEGGDRWAITWDHLEVVAWC